MVWDYKKAEQLDKRETWRKGRDPKENITIKPYYAYKEKKTCRHTR